MPSDGSFGSDGISSSWPLIEQDHASVIQNYQDRDLGRILTLLDDLNMSESTVVFFASDNGASNEGGPTLMSHDMTCHVMSCHMT